AEDAQFVQMFLDEARLAAMLNHPNICQIYEFGCNEGSYYLALEYLSGEALTAVVEEAREKEKRIAHGVAAYVVAQACEGLHYAHELTDDQGKPLQLVHRDVSPSNLFLTYDGKVKLLDFGIAKAANRIAHTTTGSLKGKLGYIAPEAYQGAPLDRRTDLFSMGVVLWELLTKKRLYKREAEYLVGKAIVEEPPPDPREIDPTIPGPLVYVALRALAKTPEERFPTALEMRRALTAYLRTLPEETDSTSIVALMEGLFGELMATRKVVLDRLRDESSQVSDIGALEATKVTSKNQSPLAVGRDFVQPVSAKTFVPVRRKRRGIWIAAGGAVAVAAAAGVWAISRPPSATGALAPPSAAVSPAAPAPTAATVPPVEPAAAPVPTQPAVAAEDHPPAEATGHHARPKSPRARPKAASGGPKAKAAFDPDAPVNPWASP
ncbi:MAG TPA: serine/threonine-protein kinase, partial [Myxococcales bacterium]|nr:serine/threonine-protein kinase [Myxococcales bacterium]